MQTRMIPWCALLPMLAGCVTTLGPEEPVTPQVGATPFAETRAPLPTKVNYAPASQEATFRVLQAHDKLIGDNPQIGLKTYIIAIGAADPEIFHVGLKGIYITEGLIRQCQTDGQLAAVLANEMGRMVSEREATVTDQVREPERLPPIHPLIGGSGNNRDADPFRDAELATFEKQFPRHRRKLTPVNPQQVARSILERAGWQRTELDAVLPILQSADRNRTLENQFKGAANQGNWKAP